jgi:hypothetical protein
MVEVKELKVEHVLMFVITAFLLYHLIGNCGCANRGDGFSVGGENISLDLSAHLACGYLSSDTTPAHGISKSDNGVCYINPSERGVVGSVLPFTPKFKTMAPCESQYNKFACNKRGDNSIPWQNSSWCKWIGSTNTCEEVSDNCCKRDNAELRYLGEKPTGISQDICSDGYENEFSGCLNSFFYDSSDKKTKMCRISDNGLTCKSDTSSNFAPLECNDNYCPKYNTPDLCETGVNKLKEIELASGMDCTAPGGCNECIVKYMDDIRDQTPILLWNKDNERVFKPTINDICEKDSDKKPHSKVKNFKDVCDNNTQLCHDSTLQYIEDDLRNVSNTPNDIIKIVKNIYNDNSDQYKGCCGSASCTSENISKYENSILSSIAPDVMCGAGGYRPTTLTCPNNQICKASYNSSYTAECVCKSSTILLNNGKCGTPSCPGNSVPGTCPEGKKPEMKAYIGSQHPICECK